MNLLDYLFPTIFFHISIIVLKIIFYLFEWHFFDRRFVCAHWFEDMHDLVNSNRNVAYFAISQVFGIKFLKIKIQHLKLTKSFSVRCLKSSLKNAGYCYSSNKQYSQMRLAHFFNQSGTSFMTDPFKLQTCNRFSSSSVIFGFEIALNRM